MSETDTQRTHCIMCSHPAAAHPKDANGLRPCRSVGHPAGMNCTECQRLLAEEALAAMQARRGAIYDGVDGPEARAWAAFNCVREWAMHEFGQSWTAFYTDIHQSALMAALIEYDRARQDTLLGL